MARRQRGDDAWLAPISIDMFVRVAVTTVFHPFVTALVPLCLRARTYPWTSTSMIVSIVWAAFISLLWTLSLINRRIAYGTKREVDLSEEIVVITGGAGGLGGLLAEVYGMRGATVAVLDVADASDGEARGVSYYKCDVGDPNELSKVAAQIEKDLGTPTILINNAAVVRGKSLLSLQPAEIESSLKTNLLAPFLTIRTFLPGIIRSATGGTIVNISSVIGTLGAAQLTDYAAAKAGITALHKSLTAELRNSHPNVKLLLVTPGQLTTPLFYGVETPSSFFAPVVEPVDVVKEIVAAVESGKGGMIGTPLYARWVDWYNVLPVGVQVLARWIAGVDRGMQTFKGREGMKSDKEL